MRRILFHVILNWKTLLQNKVDVELLNPEYLVYLKEDIKSYFWKEINIAFKEIHDKTQISNWKEYICQALRHHKCFKTGREIVLE